MESWKHGMRHEIMNSLGSIKVLSASLINMFEENGSPKPVQLLSDQAIMNSLEGLHAIKKRSIGLVQFMEVYRSLTNIPDPHFDWILVRDFMKNISFLVIPETEGKYINFTYSVMPPNQKLFADEKLIEQVFVPFYTTKKEGTGIGLSISRQIMRLHKGLISVWSEPGKETRFTLQF